MTKEWMWVFTPLGIGIFLLVVLFFVNDSSGGVEVIDIKTGNGPGAKKGDKVVVHYTGKLKNGETFDSSVESGKPFVVTLGKGEVIRGWDEGLLGMKVGGVRKLVIPPELGYGEKGSPPVIPPNAQLHFEIEMLKIN